jgi:hypothetical protein
MPDSPTSPDTGAAPATRPTSAPGGH